MEKKIKRTYARNVQFCYPQGKTVLCAWSFDNSTVNWSSRYHLHVLYLMNMSVIMKNEEGVDGKEGEKNLCTKREVLLPTRMNYVMCLAFR